MKNKIVVLVIILLISTAAYTEDKINQKVRELEKQLETVSGKERIEILFQLAEATLLTPEKSIAYCNQILDIAKQSNNPQLRANALMYVSIAYSNKAVLTWIKDF